MWITWCERQNDESYNKRMQKNLRNWVGMIIHEEFCKKLIFDHITKWYMHKAESVQEIEIRKILWDFEIQIPSLKSCGTWNDGDTDYNRCGLNTQQRLGKGTIIIGNQKTDRDHQNYRITKVSQNTGKSSEALRRLALTRSPVKDPQLTLVWKTPKA